MKPNNLFNEVAAMLHTTRIRRAEARGHSTFCFEIPKGVIVQIHLRDHQGKLVDIITLEPDENGCISLARVVYELIKTGDVAIEHTLWKIQRPIVQLVNTYTTKHNQ